MSQIVEQFYVFIKSSFGEKEKKQLYDYIWKNYRRRIAYYITSVIPYRHASFNDILQEVMLKIYNNLHTFNPLNSFKAWIYTIVRNHCLDFVKSMNERFQLTPGSDLDRVGQTNNPETISMRDELFSRIDRALRCLDPVDQEISYLRFYENIKYREIGRIVSLNANTVKAKIHDIKNRLKKELNR